jgi:hypothetical protein
MNEQVLLGQLVSGQQLQHGIALAVAQNVWHWKPGKFGEFRIWTTEDIIEVLRENTKIEISDFDDVMGVTGEQVGSTTKKWVQRAEYVRGVLLLSSSTIDILRQLRESE